MKTDCEDTFQAATDDAVCEYKPVTFTREQVAFPTRDEILVYDEITSILFQIQEAMRTLVLESLTALRMGVYNGPSPALEVFIK